MKRYKLQSGTYYVHGRRGGYIIDGWHGSWRIGMVACSNMIGRLRTLKDCMKLIQGAEDRNYSRWRQPKNESDQRFRDHVKRMAAKHLVQCTTRKGTTDDPN